MQFIKFGDHKSHIPNITPEVLGGKGANLCVMSNMKLPIPAGVIIPTDVCNQYLGLNGQMAKTSLASKSTGAVLSLLDGIQGCDGIECLYSVRSGARVSMPGMMDTVLNVGITESTIEHWENVLGKKTAWDCYRRLYQMYGDVVFGIDSTVFEGLIEIFKLKFGVTNDTEFTAVELQELVDAFKNVYTAEGKSLPQTLSMQLRGAIQAVWQSWNCDRAVEYRKIHGYPDDWGTAVTIQRMVFGNANDKSCSGVVFTRSPATGECTLYGEYLVNAQGEDVVAGIRTPENIQSLHKWNYAIAEQLGNIATNLELHYRDMQDMEFTVQDGELFILQTRNGKRSSKARLKIALDLLKEKVITKDEFKKRITPRDLIDAKLPTVDLSVAGEPMVKGIPAGGGVVYGQVRLSSQSAVDCNGPCILVAKETTPNDIAGMNASVGILTSTGGMTSHAAVVARGMNKACVVGAVDLELDDTGFKVGSHVVLDGDFITIDGTTGGVWIGEAQTLEVDDESVAEIEAMIFEGIGLTVPMSDTESDAIGGRIYLPASFFGYGGLGKWITTIEVSVSLGLTVFVSFSGLAYTTSDYDLLDITGQGIQPEKQAKDLLDCNGLLDKVEVIGDTQDVTLLSFLEGDCNTSMTTDTIINVFGSVEAYDKIIELHALAGKPIQEAPVFKTKFQIIQDALEG